MGHKIVYIKRKRKNMYFWGHLEKKTFQLFYLYTSFGGWFDQSIPIGREEEINGGLYILDSSLPSIPLFSSNGMFEEEDDASLFFFFLFGDSSGGATIVSPAIVPGNSPSRRRRGYRADDRERGEGCGPQTIWQARSILTQRVGISGEEKVRKKNCLHTGATLKAYLFVDRTDRKKGVT